MIASTAGACERPERHRDVVAVLHRGEHQQRAIGDGHALELGRHVRRSMVEIVDHQEGRPAYRTGLLDHPARRLGRAGARRVQHVGAVGENRGGELGRKPGLAHPRSPGHERLPAVAGLGAAPLLAQRCQLLLAADERRADVQLRRQLGRDRQVEGWVLPQDRLVETAQLGAGLDADRGDELVARPAVGAERVGLAPAAVEGQHAEGVEALAQRLLREQRLDLGDRLGVAAGGEVLLERLLDRGQAQLLQAADLEPRERLGGDVVERRSPPEGERLARGSLGHELLEAARVELARADPQLIAVPARDDLRAVVRGPERLAQLRDVDLDHLVRRRRRRLAPEAVDQRLGRDRGSLVEGEQGEQRARLPRADGDRLVVDARLHGSEKSKVHSNAPRRA